MGCLCSKKAEDDGGNNESEATPSQMGQSQSQAPPAETSDGMEEAPAYSGES